MFCRYVEETSVPEADTVTTNKLLIISRWIDVMLLEQSSLEFNFNIVA